MNETRFGRLLLAILFAVSAFPAALRAQQFELTDVDRRIAAVDVVRKMQQGHISHRPLDDTISKRTYRSYIRGFDPLKMYFMQSDVDDFAREEDRLDDQLQLGNIDFATAVFDRFLQRLEERTKWAVEYAKTDFDFTKEDQVVIDPDHADYAKTEQEAKDRWRRRIKYETLVLIVDGVEPEKARERIELRYTTRRDRWKQVDQDELIEMFLSSMTNSYDPHSTFMGLHTLEDFNIAIQLELEGIGAVLQAEDGMTIVKEIVPGGAADKDGRLQPGDKIVGAGQGDDGEIIDLVGMKLRDVVTRIRGKAGTKVQLEVIPAESEKRVVYTMTRQKIQLVDRAAKSEIAEAPPTADGRRFRIGVIDLPSFYGGAEGRSATSDVRKILEDYEKQGVDGVVLDLRANGGGLLSEAISLTGLFIKEGPVVLVRDFDGQTTPFLDDSPGAAYSGPLVVLVSKFSASASEIFAGAIQDYRRGIVVGDSSTHGKGTVQKIMPVNRGRFRRLGALKLTMQMFYRVNGHSTQNKGVVSDIVLPSITDHEDFSEANLDYALEFDTIPSAAYALMNRVSPELVAQLGELSKQRQESDPELKDLLRLKNLNHARRSRKVVTFTEESLRKEREELEAANKEAKVKDPNLTKIDEEEKEEEKPFGTTPYTKEVLTIASDLIRLKDTSLTAR